MPTFKSHGKRLSENIVGKGEKAGDQHFLYFPLLCMMYKKNCTTWAIPKFSSAKAFNLEMGKFLSSGKGLTLCHTIPTFNDPKGEDFGKHCGKTSIFSFPTEVSTLSKREIVILATFILLSANAFNLITSKILSFGKGLIYHMSLISYAKS